MNAMTLLDPELAALLAQAPSAPPLSAATLGAVRASLLEAARSVQLGDAVERVDHQLQSPDGYDFAVRLHRRRDTTEPAPALLWLHGGGLVAGTYLRDDARFDHWCQTLGIVGVSVDYGLAPERPYPGPFDDCCTALSWLHANADALGVRRESIGIGGASAGGCLAAAVALRANYSGSTPLAFQVLIYPMLDDRMTTASSSWDVPVWPPSSNDFGWSSYLRGRRGAADIPAYAAPARATELTGLPTTFVSVGALDGFVDEDVDYATRLMHAGVPVELHVYPGAPHGFDVVLPDSRLARRAARHLDEWLARVVNVPGPRSR